MKKSNLLVVGALFLTCLACSSRLHAGLVTSTYLSDYSTAWDGFAADFSPNWKGNTTVVETTPKNAQELNAIFSSASGTMCGTMCISGGGSRSLNSLSIPQKIQRWTVSKVNSSAYAGVNTTSDFWLAGEPYSASSAFSNSGLSKNSVKSAQYAEIVTDDGRLLANAAAVAYQYANLDARSFSANGKVSAAAILKNGAVSAESKALGTSSFEAIYSLEKNTPFSLSLDMAKLGDVDLVFSAVDNRRGETIWDLTLDNTGMLRHLEWSGILEAGEYKFSLDAVTDSLIDESGLQNAGGLAMYDVSLDFDAESYWVENPAYKPFKSSIVLGSGLLSLSSNKSNGILSFGNSANLGGGLVSFSEVPEPGTILLLFTGLLCCGLRLRARIFRGR